MKHGDKIRSSPIDQPIAYDVISAVNRPIVEERIVRLAGDLAFGEVNVGSTGDATLTIYNDGNVALTVSSISYPTGFSGNWDSGSIVANGSQEVTVTFTPTEATSYGGTVTVSSDKTSGTDTIECSGTGVAAAAWYVDGVEWTGLIKTVGASGKDYTSIGAALNATSEDILLLVDAGTYSDSIGGASFKGRKVRIRGIGASFTDVIVTQAVFDGATPLDVLYEWCDFTSGGYGAIQPKTAGHIGRFSKCRLYATGSDPYTVRADDGTLTSTWSFRQIKWENDGGGNYDIRSANGSFDISQVTMDKVWHIHPLNIWYLRRTAGSFAADDTRHNAAEASPYGPNYGDFLIVYE